MSERLTRGGAMTILARWGVERDYDYENSCSILRVAGDIVGVVARPLTTGYGFCNDSVRQRDQRDSA